LGLSRTTVPITAYSHPQTCDCGSSGFTGTACQQFVNDCSSNPCQNGATCVDGSNTFTCLCTTGFSDSLCGTETCSCLNTGSCVTGQTVFNGLRGNFFNNPSGGVPSSVPQAESTIQLFGTINTTSSSTSVIPVTGIDPRT